MAKKTAKHRLAWAQRWTYDDGVSDGFIEGIIVVGLICAVVAFGGFSCLTLTTVVDAEGTITAVTYQDVLSESNVHHRIYDITIENVTRITIDETMADGVYSTEGRSIGEHVNLVHGEWMWIKSTGVSLVTDQKLESNRANDATNLNTGVIVGWVAVAVPVAIVAVRFVAWACQFKIVIESKPARERDEIPMPGE